MRLKDILEFGRAAVELGEEALTRNAPDMRTQLALERALFLVGEAGAQLSPRARHAIDQPWRDIIGLRNVLAHRYDGIRPARLAAMATQELPALLAAIRHYLDERREGAQRP